MVNYFNLSTKKKNLLISDNLLFFQSDIVEGLKIKLKNLKAVSALEKGNPTPLFISWTTEHFCKIKITKLFIKYLVNTIQYT